MPTATDAVGVTSLVCSPSSGSTLPLGTTTVTCTAKDAANNTSTKVFTVTVAFTAYGFTGPGMPATANQGSVVTMAWQYTSGGSLIDTGSFIPTVRILRLTSCQNGTETGAAYVDIGRPGNTNFNYKPNTMTWQFNWQTPNPPFTKGCYNVYIGLMNAQSTQLQTNGPYKIQLK
jgi:HYR domain